MSDNWAGSGTASWLERAERVVREAIRRTKLEGKNDPNFVPPANALSTILAARHFAIRPNAAPPTPENLNVVMAARIFLRGHVANGSSGRRLTLGTHLTGGSYNGSADVTASVDFTAANGEYYKGVRNTGSSVINLMGFVVGTDNVEQIMAGTWTWKDTGAASLVSFSAAGAAVFASSVTATSFIGPSSSTTGNAATATALQNARTINGVSFNGTANITVTAAAGTLSGAALAAGVTSSSLTALGTLTALQLASGVMLDVDSVGGDAVAGQCTLGAGGTVTVNTTAADSFANGRMIFFQRVTAAGTIGFATTYTVVSGTSFTLSSDNPLDLSVYNWFILKVH